MITVGDSKLHWNYFLALEQDLETVSRYIEFRTPNFPTYSIELAHLLFAAASEVDVLAKLLCEFTQPACRVGNIDQYRPILLRGVPDLANTVVSVPRFELSFKPWENWASASGPNPDWWRSYNKVKHERDAHFNEATLQHVLNAMGTLLILTIHYYCHKLASKDQVLMTALQHTTLQLKPDPRLLRLDHHFYFETRPL